MAVSADRRVSIWAADWAKEKCELLDWLTFPAPHLPEVISYVFMSIVARNKLRCYYYQHSCPNQLVESFMIYCIQLLCHSREINTTPYLNQDSHPLPPSLAAFSPSERGVVVYTGYAVEKEIIFYCLNKKQVLARKHCCRKIRNV